MIKCQFFEINEKRFIRLCTMIWTPIADWRSTSGIEKLAAAPPPLRCIGEMTSLRSLLCLALLALSALLAAAQKDEATLAKAYFRWSAEGWNATTKDGSEW